MSVYSLKCDISVEEYEVITKLLDIHCCDVTSEHYYGCEPEKKVSIENANVKLLQQLLKYIISAYSIYSESKVKTILIDYEYVAKNIHTIEKAYSELCEPEKFVATRYIGNKPIDECDDDLPIPLFLCDVKYEPIKDKK